MRRAMVVLAMTMAGGCAGMPFPAMTQAALQPPERAYPHEIEYAVLDQSSARACASEDELAQLKGARTTDRAAVGHPALFERAKFDAITLAKGADGLTGVSSRVEIINGQQCVTVRGRGYRILGMRAGARGAQISGKAESTLPTAVPSGIMPLE